MNTTILRRSGAAAAVLALSISLAACGEEDTNEPTTGGEGTSESSAPEETESTPAEEGGSEGEFAVFGDACGQLPQGSDAGSLESMVVDPVATAASTNPLLTTLVTAVGAVDGLATTLDSAPADPGLTVFAPFNGAFDELGTEAVNGLVEEAMAAKGEAALQTPLAVTLSHHVLPESLDPDAVVGDQTTLIGDTLTIEGDTESGMTVSDGQVTANVLCGNIPTANATVYVIDQVLTNAMPANG